MDYKTAVNQIIRDPRYKKNVEFGEPRPGHPEGKVKFHIAALEANLERLKHHLSSEQAYWKLQFLIHTHDTFKAEATKGLPATDPRHHGALAREFASAFTDDADMLTIIQYHDESYFLWKQVKATGNYDNDYFMALLNRIDDWDLYLAFTIIDGHTEGKELGKSAWFIEEVRRYKETCVDASWLLT